MFKWRRRKVRWPCVHANVPRMSWCLYFLITLVLCRRASNASLFHLCSSLSRSDHLEHICSCCTDRLPLRLLAQMHAMHAMHVLLAQGLLLETPKKQVKKMQERPRSNKRDAMAFNKRKYVSLNMSNNATSTPRHSTPPRHQFLDDATVQVIMSLTKMTVTRH